MKRFICVLTGLLLTAPLQTAAQSIDPAAPETIVKYLSDNGYRALLEQDGEGDPVIRSGSSGTNFSIYFYGCNALHAGCDSWNFSTGYDMDHGVPVASMNDWNNVQLVGRAFVDDELDPHLDYYVSAKGGLSSEAFDGVLADWEDALGYFEDHIDW